MGEDEEGEREEREREERERERERERTLDVAHVTHLPGNGTRGGGGVASAVEHDAVVVVRLSGSTLN